MHPDHNIRVNYATYSVPTKYIGKEVDVRVDSKLVRIYLKEELIKIHPVKPPGGRSTDYDDYPKEKNPYAMRSCHYYIQKASALGPSCGEFTQNLLSGDFPLSKIRQAQKLLRLGEKYGKEMVESACRRALDLGLLNVYRLENIIKEGDSTLALLDEDSLVQTKLPGCFKRPVKYFYHPLKEEKNGNKRA